MKEDHVTRLRQKVISLLASFLMVISLFPTNTVLAQEQDIKLKKNDFALTEVRSIGPTTDGDFLSNSLDGNPNTYTNSAYGSVDAVELAHPQIYTFTLREKMNISKVGVQARSEYHLTQLDHFSVYLSSDKNDWQPVASNVSVTSADMIYVNFEATPALYVKIELYADEGVNCVSTSEVEIYRTETTTEAPTVDKTNLKAAIDKASALEQSNFTDSSWEVLESALQDAKKVYDDLTVDQDTVDEAVNKLEKAINDLDYEGYAKISEIIANEDNTVTLVLDRKIDSSRMSGSDPGSKWTYDNEYKLTSNEIPEEGEFFVDVVVEDLDGEGTHHNIYRDENGEWRVVVEYRYNGEYKGVRPQLFVQVGEELVEVTPLTDYSFDPYVVEKTLTGPAKFVITGYDLKDVKVYRIPYNEANQQVITPDGDHTRIEGFLEHNGVAMSGTYSFTIGSWTNGAINMPQIKVTYNLVDRSELEELIRQAQEIKNEGYIEESYEALQEEIKEATAVRDNNTATKNDVNDAVNALQTAIDNLEVEEQIIVGIVNDSKIAGSSLEDAVTKAGIEKEDISTVELLTGIITQSDLNYLKDCELIELTINLNDDLKMEDGSTKIPDGLFAGSSLEKLTLGGFTEIGTRAFQKSTSLNEVSIPDVVTVGREAFYRCDDYIDVILPASIEYIGDSAFAEADNGTRELKVVFQGTTPPELGNRSFGSVGTVTVPAGALKTYLPDLNITKTFYDSGTNKFGNLQVIDPAYPKVKFQYGQYGGNAFYGYYEKGAALNTIEIHNIPSSSIPEGKVLIGWNTLKDGSGISYTDDSKITSDLTLYPVYGNLVDKSELQKLYDEVKDYTSSNSFFKYFSEELEEAKEVLDNPNVSQEDVDKQVVDLNARYYALRVSELNSLYSPTNGSIDLELYTTESLAPVVNMWGITHYRTTGSYGESEDQKNIGQMEGWYTNYTKAVEGLIKADEETEWVGIAPDATNTGKYQGHFEVTKTEILSDGSCQITVKFVNDGLHPIYGESLPNANGITEFDKFTDLEGASVSVLVYDENFKWKASRPLKNITVVEDGIEGTYIVKETDKYLSFDLSHNRDETYSAGYYNVTTVPVGTITLTPEENLTGYTGGKSLDNSSFPHMRYTISLPEGVDASSGIILHYTNSKGEEGTTTIGNYQQGLSLLAEGEDANITEQPVLIPELEPSYKLNDKEAKDDSEPGVYDFEVKNDKDLYAEIKGEKYKVNVDDKDTTITVRYVSDPERMSDSNTDYINDVVNEAPATEVEEATAVTDPNTTYLTNDKEDIAVMNEDAVGLLVDELLSDDDGFDREKAMLEKLNGFLDEEGFQTVSEGNYDFMYLDLVNTLDGNAWVSSTNGTYIYLPYPEGTDENTKFNVVHFPGLHREYGFEGEYEVGVAIEKCKPELVSIENTAQGIKFHIGKSGFSPFALTWSDSKTEFDVSYVFKSEDGRVLPQEVNALLPTAQTATEGSTLSPQALTTTSITTSEGVWTFKGWDQQSVTVSQDVVFTGTWSFTANPSQPVFDLSDMNTTIEQGSKFDPLAGIHATDAQGNDITGSIKVVSNNVNTSKPGKYTVTYEVADQYGNISHVTVEFTVMAKEMGGSETANKDDLKDLIDKADKLDADKYTKDSWNALEKALEQAKNVYKDPSATAEEINSAYNALNNAMKNLKKVSEKGKDANTAAQMNAALYGGIAIVALGAMLICIRKRSKKS